MQIQTKIFEEKKRKLNANYAWKNFLLQRIGTMQVVAPKVTL